MELDACYDFFGNLYLYLHLCYLYDDDDNEEEKVDLLADFTCWIYLLLLLDDFISWFY